MKRYIVVCEIDNEPILLKSFDDKNNAIKMCEECTDISNENPRYIFEVSEECRYVNDEYVWNIFP